MAFGTDKDIEQIFLPEYDILTQMNIFLKSDNINLIEQIFWFLGNSLGENMKIRDMVLGSTCIFQVLEKLVFKHKVSRPIFSVMIWFTSNIVRYKNLSNDIVSLLI